MTAAAAPAFLLEPMRDDDVAVVAAIERRAHAFPWTPGNFADSLRAGHGMWVARENGGILGYSVLMLAVDEAHVLNVTVAPEHQRRGLGGELLARLIGTARGIGARRLLLEVRPGNRPALALYRRFGFAEIGRRKGYYQGHEDAIVMALPL